jgi:hypothetical protein
MNEAVALGASDLTTISIASKGGERGTAAKINAKTGSSANLKQSKSAFISFLPSSVGFE